jgi:hypothetical protein
MMQKENIVQLLKENHSTFIQFVDGLSADNFEKKLGNKWTAGQQLEHLCKTTKPLLLPFMLPKWLLKYKFGTANRPSKTYEALVEKYHIKLQTANAAPSRFTPNIVHFTEKKNLLVHLTKNVHTLCRLANKKTEVDLDTYILPHPLLGKLTLREMLYFTAYHVVHHQKSVEGIVQREN